MLGKLMKHEFKAISKVLFVINLVLILVTIVGCLTFVSPLWHLESDYTAFLAMASVMLYYIVILAATFITLIYLAIRFYKNLYTDEGYLMHTLPVSSHQLIFSKLIPAFVGLAITFGFVLLSIFAILGTAMGTMLSPAERAEVFQELPSAMAEIYGMTIHKFLLYSILVLIVGAVSGLLQAYASISLGQMFSGHKIAASIGCYIGIYFLMQIIGSLMTLPIMATSGLLSESPYLAPDMGNFMRYTFNSSMVLSLILCVAYYFICHFTMSKKLNLD